MSSSLTRGEPKPDRRVHGLRADVNRIDERRAVEVAFGRVDQRLLAIERVVLPPEQPGR